MHVVGGTYFEVCREPEWNELYGSGFRAAAAISGLDSDVRLSTYVSERDRPTLDSYADAYGVSVDTYSTPDTLRFSYVHGLSRPWIDPPLHLLNAQEPIQVEGGTILRYGMLEGDAIVRGERVVYDPQSTYDARPFHQNGSVANRLAVVANFREGRAMTGRYDIDEIGRSLCNDQHAEVALIKRGAAGVRVFHPDGTDDVPAFRTDIVFPIGSGDVFSAVFAHHWATLGLDPLRSAEAASRATAWYCSTRLIPIPDDPSAELRGPIRPSNGGNSPRRVYLAGPFFTTTDRWLVAEARDGLMQQRVGVFSPFHDVGIGAADVVVPKDIAELKECDAVLAILDGFDAGTSFEVGFARSLGIPVVAFVQNEPPEPLKMLVGTGCEIVDDLCPPCTVPLGRPWSDEDWYSTLRRDGLDCLGLVEATSHGVYHRLWATECRGRDSRRKSCCSRYLRYACHYSRRLLHSRFWRPCRLSAAGDRSSSGVVAIPKSTSTHSCGDALGCGWGRHSTGRLSSNRRTAPGWNSRVLQCSGRINEHSRR
jgi:hypothetical protein